MTRRDTNSRAAYLEVSGSPIVVIVVVRSVVSWQRALGDVVGYRITGFGPVATTPRRWSAVHGVQLIFASGQIIELPGGLGLHGPDRQRAHDFHAALRRACPL